MNSSLIGEDIPDKSDVIFYTLGDMPEGEIHCS